VNEMIAHGLLTGPAVPYATNTLTIMVPKGNPARIASLADLAKPDVRPAMPNPEFEGIARQIRTALTKAGGDALANAVYATKVADSSTVLTHIHHRQTPLFLMANDMDDAVPWYQGIELFVGMRRLGKEAYMISYNNDVHNPASRANQKDIAMRMQQFFDAKLKGTNSYADIKDADVVIVTAGATIVVIADVAVACPFALWAVTITRSR